MSSITIGLDIAKNVFQLHAEDEAGRKLWAKRLRRDALIKFMEKLPPALIGVEACGSSHYWGRLLRSFGHDVRLIPAQYVKPFVKRNKTDARDAEAICEAVRRPNMHFVEIKTEAQQADRALLGTRTKLVTQRTATTNAVRGHLMELGIVARQGREGVKQLRQRIDTNDEAIPPVLLTCLRLLLTQIDALDEAIGTLDKQIITRTKEHPVMRRLMTIPGVGPMIAFAVVAAIGEGLQFKSARDFAAWLGLTPQQHSSGEKQKSGKISRLGDCGLRCLFTLGASSVLRQAKTRPERATVWLRGIMVRRPTKVVVVAQAAKLARVAWAVLTSGKDYDATKLAGGKAAGTAAT